MIGLLPMVQNFHA